MSVMIAATTWPDVGMAAVVSAAIVFMLWIGSRM